jgi:hypothetical protein
MQKATKREECYIARDTFFQCQHNEGVNSEKCRSLADKYEEQCPASWRNYFNQQRERQAVLELQADISRQRTPPPS